MESFVKDVVRTSGSMIFAMEDAAALTEAGSSTELFFKDGVVAAAGGAFLGVSLPGFILYATVVGIKQNVWGTSQEQLGRMQILGLVKRERCNAFCPPAVNWVLN
jgi:hypothetical protein